MKKQSTVKNPCTRQCIFEFDENYCTGCYRTLDDVWSWQTKTNKQKKKAIKKANKLKKEINKLEINN